MRYLSINICGIQKNNTLTVGSRWRVGGRREKRLVEIEEEIAEKGREKWRQESQQKRGKQRIEEGEQEEEEERRIENSGG